MIFSLTIRGGGARNSGVVVFQRYCRSRYGCVRWILYNTGDVAGCRALAVTCRGENKRNSQNDKKSCGQFSVTSGCTCNYGCLHSCMVYLLVRQINTLKGLSAPSPTARRVPIELGFAKPRAWRFREKDPV